MNLKHGSKRKMHYTHLKEWNLDIKEVLSYNYETNKSQHVSLFNFESRHMGFLALFTFVFLDFFVFDGFILNLIFG